jgi:hypothetical protein
MFLNGSLVQHNRHCFGQLSSDRDAARLRDMPPATDACEQIEARTSIPAAGTPCYG